MEIYWLYILAHYMYENICNVKFNKLIVSFIYFINIFLTLKFNLLNSTNPDINVHFQKTYLPFARHTYVYLPQRICKSHENIAWKIWRMFW